MANRKKRLSFRGSVENRSAASSLLDAPGDTVLVQRGKPRMLVMRCPCGCGDDLIINLDPRAGYAWHLYQYPEGVTLYPSYSREDRCRSHFIVWNSRIYWCHGWETEDTDTWNVPSSVEQIVIAALPEDHFVKYDVLAARLGLIPWDVLQACRQLTRRGIALSGTGRRNTEFRKV